jgi:hypothetical protein
MEGGAMTLMKERAGAVGRTRRNTETSTSWREAGWIFKDGLVIAIERRETLVRARCEGDHDHAEAE